MSEYDKLCIETFLAKQLQLFPEKVAETKEEALEFLEDVCATVCKNKKEVIEYLEDNMDVCGLTEAEMLSAEEVFPLEDGRFLIVEG